MQIKKASVILDANCTFSETKLHLIYSVNILNLGHLVYTLV